MASTRPPEKAALTLKGRFANILSRKKPDTKAPVVAPTQTTSDPTAIATADKSVAPQQTRFQRARAWLQSKRTNKVEVKNDDISPSNPARLVAQQSEQSTEMRSDAFIDSTDILPMSSDVIGQHED